MPDRYALHAVQGWRQAFSEGMRNQKPPVETADASKWTLEKSLGHASRGELRKKEDLGWGLGDQSFRYGAVREQVENVGHLNREKGERNGSTLQKSPRD